MEKLLKVKCPDCKSTIACKMVVTGDVLTDMSVEKHCMEELCRELKIHIKKTNPKK